MIKVTTIRFRDAGKLYDYEPAPFDIVAGDKVIVESGDGEDIATVAYAVRKVEERPEQELKHVLRKATENDIKKLQAQDDKGAAALPYIKQRVREKSLEMSVVNVEYSFDDSKIVVNFTAEERVDFRELLKELGSHFKKRVELRQIGIRDETKLVGGLGVCGQPCCCKRFLDDFGHVSVKMAKNQNLSLNPTKISGLCGRLMCCLAYENQNYEDAQKDLPKIGSEVKTPDGNGKLISANVIKEQASVKFIKGDETTITSYPFCDISSCEHCQGNCPRKNGENPQQNTREKPWNKNKKHFNKGDDNNGIQDK